MAYSVWRQPKSEEQIRAEERERCAKLAESFFGRSDEFEIRDWNGAVLAVADAIRNLDR